MMDKDYEQEMHDYLPTHSVTLSDCLFWSGLQWSREYPETFTLRAKYIPDGTPVHAHKNSHQGEFVLVLFTYWHVFNI